MIRVDPNVFLQGEVSTENYVNINIFVSERCTITRFTRNNKFQS